jgi:alkyl sulfatase BDS1-like metallo-beta-lactamase superfamily hydrolase
MPQLLERMLRIACLPLSLTFASGCVSTGTLPLSNASKPATQHTIDANQAVAASLPFNDKADFEDAQRGLKFRPPTLTITNDQGVSVWDLEEYKAFISPEKPAPESVNPSLWRNAQLNMYYGLFEVTTGIYQVRGFDLSNITFVDTQAGWIVFDPLISKETAKAAYALLSEQVKKQPIAAVIYSHSHTDHYGGVRGIVNEQDVLDGKVQIIAPVGFTEHAVSENVIAGNAMARRAIYMYGALLPRGPQGGVNGGLGQTTSTGEGTLILPTHEVTTTGETIEIGGVKMIFQMTPGSEAPAEMNTYFPAPDMKALWMAENTTNTMHNVLTLRGAQVRDPLKWSSYIQETMESFAPDAEVKFQSHHWPVWGNRKIKDYLQKQGDIYKYIHDQSVRMMNMGLTGPEIAEAIQLPPELEQNWPTRGYYGTLRHNSRAVYQRYMGWYDGNPPSLNNLPPEPAAKKYVEYMGGEAALLERARTDFANGEYRWVAEALKHAVFANPQSQEAKYLLADALEQLGYQAESGPWRSVYLQGSYELRNGVPTQGGAQTATPDVIRAMPPEMLFDYLSVRLNGERAAGKVLRININYTDLKKSYGLRVENAVLHYSSRLEPLPHTSITLTKAALDSLMLGDATLEELTASNQVQITDTAPMNEFLGLLDVFPFWFNIVTP